VSEHIESPFITNLANQEPALLAKKKDRFLYRIILVNAKGEKKQQKLNVARYIPNLET